MQCKAISLCGKLTNMFPTFGDKAGWEKTSEECILNFKKNIKIVYCVIEYITTEE